MASNLLLTNRSSPPHHNWLIQPVFARFSQDLPIYMLSGSDDPVGQQLAGVSVLIERYRSAGIQKISHDSYPGGRHEIRNEINRDEVRTNLPRWISGVFFQSVSACC
jgi:alpha-beta hydrolase superfamily lysophospholipase